MLRYSDFEFNIINIRFYITKGYQCRINLSSVVVLSDQSLIFFGNDAIELAYQGAPHGVIGQIGFDTGFNGWGSGGTTTTDHTLRRKCSVTTGDWNDYDSFDPAVEWEAYPVNTFDGLGSHCQ